MALDDQELILEACRGNMQAFEELIFRYDDQVLSIAMSYVGNTEEAKGFGWKRPMVIFLHS